MKLEKQLPTGYSGYGKAFKFYPNRPGEPLKSLKEEINRSVLDYRKII